MRFALPTLALVLVGALPVLAGDVIVFEDGRTLEVARWEASGVWAHLDLEGGGRISVPLSRIESVSRLPVRESPADPNRGADMPNEAWRALAGPYADSIEAAARRHELDPVLLAAIAEVESNFDPFAVSHKGACGILQLLPETGERFGVKDLFDVEQNLDGGARYLRWLLDHFDGNTDLALAAYNAGEQAVERHGGIPPYAETRDYVVRVLDRIR